MGVYKAAIAAPLLIASVSAWGNSVIKNSCGSTVYFWEDKGVYGPPMQSIQPGNSYTKPLYQTGKDNGAGPSFKLVVARPDGSMPVENKDGMTQFEYTVDAPTFPGRTSCDISNVNGQGDPNDPNVPHLPPFIPGGISLSSPQDPNLKETCPAGQNPCKAGYTAYNDDWATVVTDMNNDIVMDLCGPNPGTKIPAGSGGGNNGGNGGGNSGGNNSPPAPSSSAPAPSSPPPSSSAAAPSTSQAPPPPVENKIAEAPAPAPAGSTQVVWVTEYAPAETVVVHVNAKRDEAQEKREAHVHNHAHAHNKINKRRHGGA